MYTTISGWTLVLLDEKNNPIKPKVVIPFFTSEDHVTEYMNNMVEILGKGGVMVVTKIPASMMVETEFVKSLMVE